MNHQLHVYMQITCWSLSQAIVGKMCGGGGEGGCVAREKERERGGGRGEM